MDGHVGSARTFSNAFPMRLDKQCGYLEPEERVDRKILGSLSQKINLTMKSGVKKVDENLISKLSQKLEAVLSPLPQQHDRVSDAINGINGHADGPEIVNRLLCTPNNSTDIAVEDDNIVSSVNGSTSDCCDAMIPQQLSMDRMELTLKIPNTLILSDSDDSSVNDKIRRSSSCHSSSSTCSTVSSECVPDEMSQFCQQLMKSFVSKIFTNSQSICVEDKAEFGELCRHEAGRRWFSRYINTQRVATKEVSESTFYSLVQYFSIVLFECNEGDDFSPAKTLMNMSFTFYHRNKYGKKEFLYKYLKQQPIWHSIRYWNAAFFEAVQSERQLKPMITNREIGLCTPEDITDDKHFQENITFGQLGTFTFNMHSFGLNKRFCSEFLKKQSTIANLSKEQDHMLVDNVCRMFGKK